MRTQRRIGPIAVAVVVIAAMVGCTPRQEVDAKINNGSLVFVFCKPSEGNQIDLRVNGDKVWEVSSTTTRPFAKEVVYGEVPDGFSIITDAPDLEFSLYRRITINLLNVQAMETVGAYSGTFDGRLLSGKKWLDENGQLHDQPCN